MHVHSVLFNDGWAFKKMPVSATYEDIASLPDMTAPPLRFEDLASGEYNRIGRDWATVEIPHDWLIWDVQNLDESCSGWYKKTFERSAFSHEYITFDGVYMNTTVWINGREAFYHPYGYSTYSFDMAPFLREGQNTLVVRCVFETPNSRWYSGAGIYRNVYRTCLGDTHFAVNGTYYCPRKEEDSWTLYADYEILSPAPGAMLSLKVSDAENVLIKECYPLSSFDDPSRPSLKLTGLSPKLWDIDSPCLYLAEAVILSKEGTVIDAYTDRIGFKDIRFTVNDGLFLNGRYVKLRGVCQHHDLGSLGTAVSRSALLRQIRILKEMGVNSIRTSHNMPSRELMNLADEEGILINDEAFDMWQNAKTKYDYARFFDQWHERDVQSWVLRDRNHASLFLWSIGNEISDTHEDAKKGLRSIRSIKAQVQKCDPRGNGQITFGSNFMPWENTQKCAEEIPIVGYNYGEWVYDEHREKHPGWIMYGSETASTVQSRSVYHFPLKQPMMSNDDMQCSTLGNCTTVWGSKSCWHNIVADRDRRYILGQYVWSGFDYIGEPTPYFTKNTYLGQIDTAGYPKDTYYAYKAEWTDYRKAPFVHVLPYWDFNEGQKIDVRVMTNCPALELFFNGTSLGRREIDHEHGTVLTGDYILPYRQGILTALGLDENGKTLARDQQRSFGEAATIKLTPDKEVLTDDGDDLIFVDITCADLNGSFVANARNRMEVIVTGAARLVGLDNGDSTDYDAYKGICRRLFYGRLLAILKGNGREGDITLTVRSRGLSDAVLHLQAVRGNRPAGLSDTMMHNLPYPSYANAPFGGLRREEGILLKDDELSARRIDLKLLEGSRDLTADAKEAVIEARILPEDADYNDLRWRIVNDAGADLKLALITPGSRPEQIRLTALGDGEFRLRCQLNNGRSIPEIISDLEFTASGLGSAVLDPYEEVLASLLSESSGPLNSANERGISPALVQDTYIAYDNLDFGDYGSDELTIPFFHNSFDPLVFELWEGMPGRDPEPEILLRTQYVKDPVWNTYIEETFRLPRRLKGVTNLTICLHQPVHFKGFRFKKYDKAYALLTPSDRSMISGDSYTDRGDAITGIGNNVSIEFTGLDFKDRGFSKVHIRGLSHIPVNPVHLRFKGDGGNVNLVVNVPHTDEPADFDFDLPPVYGRQTLTLVFMPGSNFDFESIRFE